MISIQKWWKKIKKKNVDKKEEIIYKIPKKNNLNQNCYLSKFYYKNNILSIILIQKYFKKYLSKINFSLVENLFNNNSIIQKPQIKACYITKITNNRKFI